MKRSLMLACALGLIAAPADAQEELLARCGTISVQYSPAPPPTGGANVEDQFRRLCGFAVDALTNVQPTVGIAFSGGNHTLGTASTIGRRLGLFPRVAATVRVNAALARAPNLLDGFESGLQEDGELPPMETIWVPVPALQGDVTLGLFNGFSFGPLVSGLGSVDLLGSLSFVPKMERAGLTEEIINWGLGARLGILRQGLLMPGVSVSGMYRNMGTVSFGTIDDGNPSAGDPAHFATDLSTISLRAGVSKGFLAFDFAAGGGYDIYKSDVTLDWVVVCPPSQCTIPVSARPFDTERGETGLRGELQTAAWNVFANAGLSLVLLNIVGEVGYQKATDVISAADLQEAGLPERRPSDEELGGGRFFLSLGVRLTL